MNCDEKDKLVEKRKSPSLLVEDRTSLEVKTPDGDRLIKTTDREKTAESRKETQ